MFWNPNLFCLFSYREQTEKSYIIILCLCGRNAKLGFLGGGCDGLAWRIDVTEIRSLDSVEVDATDWRGGLM